MLSHAFAVNTGVFAAETFAWFAAAALAASLAYAFMRYFRKHRFAEFGVRLKHFDLLQDGRIEYAEWDHPKTRVRDFQITQADVDFYRRFVSAGDFVIDIGAYCGDKTVPMALAAGATGCVLALEPNPHVFKALARNAELNRLKTNIFALNAAATNFNGQFTFHYSDASFCNGGYLSQIRSNRHGHRHELKVDGQNLCQLLREKYADRLERLALIKLDAEGYDREIIRSIMDILCQYHPVLICEVYKHLTRSERDELFDVICDAGYDMLDEQNMDGGLLAREDIYKDRTMDILALPAKSRHLRFAA